MKPYPALFDEETATVHPLGDADVFLVGRSEAANLPVLDPHCSRSQFRIVKDGGGYFVEALSQFNPTSCDGRKVEGRVPLAHESLLQAGSRRFRFLERPLNDSAPRKLPPPPSPSQAAAPTPRRPPPIPPLPMPPIPPLPMPPIPPSPSHAAGPTSRRPSVENQQTVMADSGEVARIKAAILAQSIPVAGKMLIGREKDRVQIHLPHPHVSRLHAQILVQNGTAVVRDLNSANGTFVNGARLKKPTRVKPGDQLDVGPYALVFTGDQLIPRSRSDNVELIAHKVRRVVTNRETGKPLTLLDDVTIVIRPREFVCLLGPSGSGKSTLLSALSGRAPADSGTVLLNGKDLYAHFEALKQDMAVVPQKDVLHESLTVRSALWYTARLRLPPDTNSTETRSCIDQILDTVSLKGRAGTVIRHLSGGQVKRASLANEILCKPSLLFLDEVTSGLDEQTDREMMDLFRSLADSGKTVVCITHSLANVERTCHLVVILAEGGRLAFVGTPAEALQYFRVQRLGDVYERLAEQSPDEWKAAFAASPLYARYVTARLPPEVAAADAAYQAPRSLWERLTLFTRQTTLLTRRYFTIWLGDRSSLLAMLGQSVVVALLLVILFGDLRTIPLPKKARGPDGKEVAVEPDKHALRSVSLLFLLAVSSFWFGCNNAAKEIVKERTIYTRERDFNLLAGSYYASKFLLLMLFSGLQTLLLYGIVENWCGPPGDWSGHVALLSALSAAGVALGLAISAASKTEEMAVTLVPLAIIPQIILSGAIAPLSGLSETIALAVVTTYWGKRGLDGLLPEAVAKGADVEQNSAVVALVVLLLHTLVFVAAAWVLLRLQERRKIGLGRLLFRRKAG